MQNYVNKFDNLDKVNTFLRKYKWSKLTPGIGNLIIQENFKDNSHVTVPDHRSQKLHNWFYTVGKTFKPKVDKRGTHTKKVTGHSLLGTYM